MSGQRDWNDMSSDEDDDSWFDDEETSERREEVAVVPKDPPQSEKQSPTSTITVDPPAPAPSTQHKQAKQEQREKPKRQGQGERRPFLKDEQLLVEYTNKTVDDPRVIKAVKVNNQDHKAMLKALKNTRVREIHEGIFILAFETHEGLLEFIKDKIANRYRFFLQPFFKRKEEEGREQRRGERNGGKRERDNEGRRDREHERQRKPRYQDEKEQQGRGRRQKEGKQSRRQKEQQKGKKAFLAKESFQIESNKNILTIKSDAFQVDKVLEQLQEKKVFKNFNKLRIVTKFAFIAKVSKLVTTVGLRHKFYLDKEPPAEANKEDEIELTLIENIPPKAAKALADKYQEERPAKSKESRPQQPPVAKSEQVVVNSRKLDGNFEGYFLDVSKYNLSEIVKGFDQNQYVKRLKENSATIQKNWNSWKIEAEDQIIEALLKLTHRLTKSTLYDVELKPSMRNLKPILTAELKPRPEKDRRPKVDVSGVNGYLS